MPRQYSCRVRCAWELMYLWVVRVVYNLGAGKVVVRGKMGFVLRRWKIHEIIFLLAMNYQST